MIILKKVGALCPDLQGALCSGQVGALSSGQMGAVTAEFPITIQKLYSSLINLFL